MNTQDNNNIDPFDSANNAQVPSKNFFGLNMFDMYYCALIKGQGKVPFDPNMHQSAQKRTAVNISIAPLTGSKATFPIERQLIAEFGDWPEVIMPSIRALGLTAREMNGKFVKVELVPTGTYVKNGETKQLTTPRYLEVFADEATCQAASDTIFSKANTEQLDEEAFPAKAPNGNNPERDIALKFLPALITQAGKEPSKVAELLASNNLVGKYFNLNSPEVINLITA